MEQQGCSEWGDPARVTVSCRMLVVCSQFSQTFRFRAACSAMPGWAGCCREPGKLFCTISTTVCLVLYCRTGAIYHGFHYYKSLSYKVLRTPGYNQLSVLLRRT